MPVLGSWKTPLGRGGRGHWRRGRPRMGVLVGGERWRVGLRGGRAGLRVGQQKGSPRSCPATALYSMWARLAGLTAPSPLGKDRAAAPRPVLLVMRSSPAPPPGLRLRHCTHGHRGLQERLLYTYKNTGPRTMGSSVGGYF